MRLRPVSSRSQRTQAADRSHGASPRTFVSDVPLPSWSKIPSPLARTIAAGPRASVLAPRWFPRRQTHLLLQRPSDRGSLLINDASASPSGSGPRTPAWPLQPRWPPFPSGIWASASVCLRMFLRLFPSELRAVTCSGPSSLDNVTFLSRPRFLRDHVRLHHRHREPSGMPSASLRCLFTFVGKLFGSCLSSPRTVRFLTQGPCLALSALDSRSPAERLGRFQLDK